MKRKLPQRSGDQGAQGAPSTAAGRVPGACTAGHASCLRAEVRLQVPRTQGGGGGGCPLSEETVDRGWILALWLQSASYKGLCLLPPRPPFLVLVGGVPFSPSISFACSFCNTARHMGRRRAPRSGPRHPRQGERAAGGSPLLGSFLPALLWPGQERWTE